MWEVGLPHSPVKFSSLRHSHKLSCSLLLGAHPCSHQSLSSQAGLFIYSSGKDFCSPTLQCSVHPTLFATCLYCSYCLLLSFSFFPGGGQSLQGAMLFWPRVVSGSTAYRLAHLVHVFPSHLGTGNLRPGGPPGFSV
jgi:hypothetical protein